MKRIAFLVLLLSILFSISCSDHNNSEVSILSLDQTEIAFEDTGGTIKIKLTANGSWETDNIPNWVSLDYESGDTSQEITITIDVNKETKSRESKILFVSRDQSATLSISQDAVKKELAWASLPFSIFDNASFIIGDNNVERVYNFTAKQMFVNPNTAINEKIFLGNLVNRQLLKNTDILEYAGYTFNPITAFPLVGTEKSKTFTPSKKEQNVYAAQILANQPTQSESFITDNSGVVYRSHRELNLIGRGNMGVNLDELISGKSYMEQEMIKGNGLIYSFSHTLFSLGMDLQEHLVVEEIKKEDFLPNSISFVSSVSYGRIGLLIIESDYNITEIRTIVNKIWQKQSEPLSQEDLTILNDVNAYHLYYDQSQILQTKKGKADVIEAYRNQVTDDLFNVFPFKFTVSDYFEQGETSMTFSLELP